MAHAMRLALESGYHGVRSGRIGKKLHASASSPWEGSIASIVIPGE
jgi:thiazole synthase ThiGH ThiG subunit